MEKDKNYGVFYTLFLHPMRTKYLTIFYLDQIILRFFLHGIFIYEKMYNERLLTIWGFVFTQHLLFCL